MYPLSRLIRPKDPRPPCCYARHVTGGSWVKRNVGLIDSVYFGTCMHHLYSLRGLVEWNVSRYHPHRPDHSELLKLPIPKRPNRQSGDKTNKIFLRRGSGDLWSDILERRRFNSFLLQGLGTVDRKALLFSLCKIIGTDSPKAH